jgi:hypothetical protein
MSLLRIICDGDDPTHAQGQSARRALRTLAREGGRKNAAPEDSAERKFYTRQLQGIRFSREEAGQAAKVADSTRPSALQIIWPA